MSKRSKRRKSESSSANQVPSDGWKFSFDGFTQGERLQLMRAFLAVDASPLDAPKIYPFFAKIVARWPYPGDPRDISSYSELPPADFLLAAAHVGKELQKFLERESARGSSSADRWEINFGEMTRGDGLGLLQAAAFTRASPLNTPLLYPFWAKIVKQWPYPGNPKDPSSYDLLPIADFQRVAAYIGRALEKFLVRENAVESRD